MPLKKTTPFFKPPTHSPVVHFILANGNKKNFPIPGHIAEHLAEDMDVYILSVHCVFVYIVYVVCVQLYSMHSEKAEDIIYTELLFTIQCILCTERTKK